MIADSKNYPIPARSVQTEIEVAKSRFITHIGYTPTTADSKAFIAGVRSSLSDADHHVYAFKIGYGNSIIEGMSDDGEPSGTAGPPVLAVLRGQNIGDVTVVVTRYFGGILLGTGGLVRAYTEAAQNGFANLVTERKIARKIVGLETPYNFFQPIRKLMDDHEGVDIEETFAGSILLSARFPVDHVEPFIQAVIELTAGRVEPLILDE